MPTKQRMIRDPMTWNQLTFFAVAIAGWMNRQQQDVISYLREENRILREKIGHKRILLNGAQKRRLATAAMKLGRDLLRQFGCLFSPDTLLKWHHLLIARKYDGSGKGKHGPKPPKANMIRDPVPRMTVRMRDGTTPQRAGKTVGSGGGSMPQPDSGWPRLRVAPPGKRIRWTTQASRYCGTWRSR